MLAEPAERGHRGRHREAHQEGGREHQHEAEQEPHQIGECPDPVEHAIEHEPVADQDHADRDEHDRHNAACAVEKALRHEAAQA